MKEIVIESDVSQDSKVLDLVKKQMNAWARSIPHHPYQDLGSSVHFESIHSRPAYLVLLQTLYEFREKRSSEEPYRGESIPSKIYSSLSQVDEWSYTGKDSPDFTDSDEWYYVPGSQEVNQCSSCGGAGRSRCSSCGGNGIVTCSSCRGAGTVLCSSCNGAGQQRKSCSSCNGTGSKWNQSQNRNEKCFSCDGKGSWFEKCYSCSGSGRKKCTSCSGAGRVSCSSCGGDGVITCSRCSGKGRVLKSFQVRQILSAKLFSSSLLHEKVKTDFPHFSINNDKNKGEPVLKVDKTTLTTTELDKYPTLAPSFKDLLQKAGSASPKDYRITRQQLQVFKIPVYQVRYSMDDRSYDLLLFGEEGEIYASSSPISEFMNQYVVSAEQYYREKKYYEAWHQVNKALDMGKDQPQNIPPETTALANRIRNKIREYYTLGQSVGAGVSVLVFTPLIFLFLSRSGFILPFLNTFFNASAWMKAIHPYVLYFLFIIGLLRVYFLNMKFMTGHFLGRIASNTAQVWIAAAFFFGFAALYWVLLAVVNAVGITLVFTYLGEFLAIRLGIPPGSIAIR